MATMGMIDGVKKIPLKRHVDDRGYVEEILRSDDPHFEKFGQIYVTTCRKNVIKAWHRHQYQTDHFYVVSGTVKVGLYDDREGSASHGRYMQAILGEQGEDILLIIPRLVWHGQMALSEFSYMINIPTMTYNREQPDEQRKGVGELEDIWTIVNR
jgi:dTDP-4-dehydrorhamnose 3,5-epimerase